MRIALVCPYTLDRPGGVRTHIAGLGVAMQRRGHDVEVLAPTDIATLDSLPVVSCGEARRKNFGGTQIDLTWAPWSRVADVCRRPYDVMHFHTIWNPLVSFQLAACFRGPKVATFHDVPGPDTPRWASALMSPMSELIRRVALNGVIAVSPAVSSYLHDAHHVVIPNGLSIPDALPTEDSRDVVLYVGRLEPRKGIHTLIDAATLLGDDGPPIWIAGDGPLRAQLETAAPRCVRFLGEVTESEKWSLLRRASVVVAPSLGGESFGIVLLEAMAAGAPPIAANNPGYSDVLAEQADELLFPRGDARALADRIAALLRDRPRRDALRTWGEKRVRQYDWRVLAERVELVYEGAIAARAGLQPPSQSRATSEEAGRLIPS